MDEKKLNEILTYAYENSLFYRALNIKDIDISNLPVITKKMIMESREPIEAIPFMLGNDDDIISCTTSGTTGMFMRVNWNRYDYYSSLTPLWILRKKYYDINPNDRMCFFYTISELEEEDIMEYRKNALGFSKSNLTYNNLQEIYSKMYDYNPTWMLLQPSVAMILMEFIEKNELPKLRDIRYIEFSGEMLSLEFQKRIERFFHCQSANQYGANEVNSIAYQCKEGNMHCLGSNVYVEVLDDNDKMADDNVIGNIVLTSLQNHMTPFIRYKIGDMGSIDKNITCKCGNRSPVLKLNIGRCNDYIKLDNGEKVPAYMLTRIIEKVNVLTDDAVYQYQIIQKKIDKFMIKLSIRSMAYQLEVENIFADEWEKTILCNASYKIEFFDSVIVGNATGKHKYFISEV